MLLLRLNTVQNTARTQSYLFTVQCCHSDSKADGTPMCKTLSEHRVISSLFNVVIETQRQMDPPSQHCQSTEWSLHCSMLWFTFKGRWIPLKHCQSTELSLQFICCHRLEQAEDLFTVQCCHDETKADGPTQSTQLEHRVISSLFNVVNIETQRQMDLPLINTVRAQSDLFTVQCCHSDCKNCTRVWPPSDSKAGGLPSTLSEHRVISSLFNVVIQTQRQIDLPQSTLSEHRVISSLMLSLRLKGRWTAPSQHCQHMLSLHCSMLQMRLKDRWTPQNSVRAQSYLFTVQCCHSGSKADGPPLNTVRAQSDLFTVQCCHSNSKAEGAPWSTLSEHRVISSLFNVVIEAQRQMDPPVNIQSTDCEWSFTVQCCHSDSKADGPPCSTCQSTEWSFHCSMLSLRITLQMDRLCAKHCQSTESSLHCSMLSFRLNCRWTPCKPLSEHRVISSLCNVVIENHRQMDHLCVKHCQSTEWSLHCSMLSFRLKGRWTPLVNTVRAQSDLFTVQCCHSDSKADGLPA